MLKGILIQTNLVVKKITIDKPHLENIQKLVGGYPELVLCKTKFGREILPNDGCFLCNEDGLQLQLPLNIIGTSLYGSSPVVGDIILLKTGSIRGEQDLVSLTDDEIAKILTFFARVDRSTM
jgi:hypothetical protein